MKVDWETINKNLPYTFSESDKKLWQAGPSPFPPGITLGEQAQWSSVTTVASTLKQMSVASLPVARDRS